MRSALRILGPLAALAGIGIFGGCVGGYVEGGGGPVPVYGDFGYVGPWGDDAPSYDEGGVYVHPPFRRDGGGDDHRGGGSPGRGAPEPGHAQPHAPSIPTAPRPSGGGGGGGSHGGGGGAGHSGGGGGGNRRS